MHQRRTLRWVVLVTAVSAICAPGLATARPGDHRNAVVVGHLKWCGGPAPGRCGIGEINNFDRVEAVDVRGRRVAMQTIRNGRFRFHVKPGTYLLLLLADAKGTHHVVQRQHVKARANHTTVVVFFFSIP